MSAYFIRQRVKEIRRRLDLATRWPWRASGSTVIAPATLPSSMPGADWQYYGGNLIAESVDGLNAALIERAPEDLAFLSALVLELLEDRHRLDFLIDERFACDSREQVDQLMARKDQCGPLSIVPADYPIVEETKVGAA